MTVPSTTHRPLVQIPLTLEDRNIPCAAAKRIVALAARAKLILLTEEFRYRARNAR